MKKMKKIMLWSSLEMAVVPILTMLSCTSPLDENNYKKEDGYQYDSLDQESEEFKNAKTYLEKTNSWKTIDKIHARAKGNWKVGEINVYIEGKDWLDNYQKVTFNHIFNFFNESSESLTAQVNGGQIIEDLQSNSIIQDTINYSLPKWDFINLLKVDYPKASVEFTKANQTPDPNFLGLNWETKPYNQARFIFPKESIILQELLDVDQSITTINDLPTHFENIRNEMRKRIFFFNNRYPEFIAREKELNAQDPMESQLHFEVLPSIDGQENDHVELRVDNLDLYNSQYIFNLSIFTLTGIDKILNNLMTIAIVNYPEMAT